MNALGSLADPESSEARRLRGADARFEAFVEEHQDRALRVAVRLLGDERAAEDVAQDAFLRAFRGLGRFRGDSSLATWFYRILLREAARHRRWRALRRRWSAETPGEVPDPRPARAPDPALRRRIHAALDGLSRGQREAFVLVHLEGFTVVEAARATGRAPGTLKAHLHRALAKLRESLRDLRPDPEDGSHDPKLR